MKTIKERAKDALGAYDWDIYYHYSELTEDSFKEGYIQGATEQEAIDDAELARLKKAWEKEAEVNHDTAMAYKQGRHDAIDKACEWLINTYLGDYITDEFGNGGIGDNVKLAEDFRKAMEEE